MEEKQSTPNYGSGNILEEKVEGLQEPEDQEMGCETIYSRNSCLSKTESVATSTDRLMRMKRIFMGSIEGFRSLELSSRLWLSWLSSSSAP